MASDSARGLGEEAPALLVPLHPSPHPSSHPSPHPLTTAGRHSPLLRSFQHKYIDILHTYYALVELRQEMHKGMAEVLLLITRRLQHVHTLLSDQRAAYLAKLKTLLAAAVDPVKDECTRVKAVLLDCVAYNVKSIGVDVDPDLGIPVKTLLAWRLEAALRSVTPLPPTPSLHNLTFVTGNVGVTITRLALAGKDNRHIIYVNVYQHELFPGVYHSGVEIRGKEYCYVFHKSSSTGVIVGTPRHPPAHYTFLKSLEMGVTSLSPQDLHHSLYTISQSFQGNQYSLIQRNCNHFSDVLLFNLTGQHLPPWINRVADTVNLVPGLPSIENFFFFNKLKSVVDDRRGDGRGEGDEGGPTVNFTPLQSTFEEIRPQISPLPSLDTDAWTQALTRVQNRVNEDSILFMHEDHLPWHSTEGDRLDTIVDDPTEEDALIQEPSSIIHHPSSIIRHPSDTPSAKVRFDSSPITKSSTKMTITGAKTSPNVARVSSTTHHPSSTTHHPSSTTHRRASMNDALVPPTPRFKFMTHVREETPSPSHPSSIIHHPSSTFHHPSLNNQENYVNSHYSTNHRSSSVIHHLPSSNPSSITHHPSSTTPSSTIHHPSSITTVTSAHDIASIRYLIDDLMSLCHSQLDAISTIHFSLYPDPLGDLLLLVQHELQIRQHELSSVIHHSSSILSSIIHGYQDLFYLLSSKEEELLMTVNGERRMMDDVMDMLTTLLTSKAVIARRVFSQVTQALRGRGLPDNMVPDNMVPDEEVPDNEVPNKEVSENEVLDNMVPDTEISDKEVPDEEVPDEEVPDEEVPDEEVPDNGVPDNGVPDCLSSDDALLDLFPPSLINDIHTVLNIDLTNYNVFTSSIIHHPSSTSSTSSTHPSFFYKYQLDVNEICAVIASQIKFEEKLSITNNITNSNRFVSSSMPSHPSSTIHHPSSTHPSSSQDRVGAGAAIMGFGVRGNTQTSMYPSSNHPSSNHPSSTRRTFADLSLDEVQKYVSEPL